jgi:hypothetical protein
MTSAWAQRQEELLSDCIVSPDVFNPMVDRLAEFVHSRPGSPTTGVSRARSSSKGPVAVGDGLAQGAPSDGLEAADGTRR